MPNSADVLWFKTSFQPGIESTIGNSPLTVDFIVAIACQETGHIWSALRKKSLTIDQILALCVGDTLDSDKGRVAFPKTKADLLAAPRGDAMFAIAHQALVDMAGHVGGFEAIARRPNKFCHAFGLFQSDLQFFRTDPDYFLNRDYESFDKTLGKCVEELRRALKRLGFENRSSLSDLELAAVGIAYNTGGFKPNKGLKQGHFDGSRFYGEAIFDFIQLAHTVALPGEATILAPAARGEAVVPPPGTVTASGAFFKVDTQEGMLRVRSEPRISEPPQANVIGNLPDGHLVRAVTNGPVGTFREVETSLSGALLRGFAATKFLVADREATEIPVVKVAIAMPTSGVVAVTMPQRARNVSKRTAEATSHSLNEIGQPGRQGTTPEALRSEMGAIVDWLAVDKPAHKRYQPRAGLTFCNIYCHDFCHLAGVYLPRVWWTTKAIVALNAGKTVEPLIGDTIVEMRANDLFRWLRDFGAEFGWRQTGGLTKLQTAVDQGAIGLIVARRKEDGRSGHVVMVVPETDSDRAKRDATGEVTSPLQSQAGVRNFRYGTGTTNWWNGEEFAESGFWLHA